MPLAVSFSHMETNQTVQSFLRGGEESAGRSAKPPKMTLAERVLERLAASPEGTVRSDLNGHFAAGYRATMEALTELKDAGLADCRLERRRNKHRQPAEVWYAVPKK